MTWQTKTIGEIMKLEYGRPLPKSERLETGGYPAYGANGEKCRSSNFYVDQRSIVVGRKGSAGELKLAEEKFWPLDVTYYATFDPLCYDLKFLYYLLKTQDLPKLARGVKPGINRNDVYSIAVQVPESLPEQKRIVSILDAAFAAIEKAKENAEKNLRNAKELFDSVLWSINAPEESLKSLVDIKTGKLDANAAVEDGQYPFFTCSREASRIDDYAFDCEAILLAGNNAVGDFNVKHYKGKFNAYQRTYVITVNSDNKILYRYLYFQMLKSLKAFKTKSVGVGTKFLRIGMIKDMQIALPSIDEQQAIIKQLDETLDNSKRIESCYTQKIAALGELKQSLLHKAFNGEL